MDEVLEVCAADEKTSTADVLHDPVLEESLAAGVVRDFAGHEQGREAATRGHDLHGARRAGSVVDQGSAFMRGGRG